MGICEERAIEEELRVRKTPEAIEMERQHCLDCLNMAEYWTGEAIKDVGEKKFRLAMDDVKTIKLRLEWLRDNLTKLGEEYWS